MESMEWSSIVHGHLNNIRPNIVSKLVEVAVVVVISFWALLAGQ